MIISPHLVAEGLCNTYIIAEEVGRDAILVDPAGVDTQLIDIIESHRLNLTTVLVTHRHANHTAGLAKLMRIYNPKIYAFSKSIQGFDTITLADGEEFLAAGIHVIAIQVPGHSLDSLVYQIGHMLFTGDTLHSGCIGSTKNHMERRLLEKSLKTKIMTLDDNTLVFPGHGPISKLRIERMFNHDILESNATLI